LKAEFKVQAEAWKSKENRYLLNQDRLKRKLDDSAKQNRELIEQIKILEQERALFLENKATPEKHILNSLKKSSSKNEPSISSSIVSVTSPAISRLANSTRKKSGTNIAKEDLDKLQNELELGKYEEVEFPDGRLERSFGKGAKIIWFTNRSMKYLVDEMEVLFFSNGDSKTVTSSNEDF
jgi:hypothetical protein